MINWTITELEADYVMRCLQTRPYAEVRALVDKLVEQANVDQGPKTSGQASLTDAG